MPVLIEQRPTRVHACRSYVRPCVWAERSAQARRLATYGAGRIGRSRLGRRNPVTAMDAATQLLLAQALLHRFRSGPLPCPSLGERQRGRCEIPSSNFVVSFCVSSPCLSLSSSLACPLSRVGLVRPIIDSAVIAIVIVTIPNPSCTLLCPLSSLRPHGVEGANGRPLLF